MVSRDWSGRLPEGRLHDDEVMDRIAIIGHHLEWIAIARLSFVPQLPP